MVNHTEWALPPETQMFWGHTAGEWANWWGHAILKEDGSVVTFLSDGDSSAVTDLISSGVVQVFSSGSGFAALKDDGSVVIWWEGGGEHIVPEDGRFIHVFSTMDDYALLNSNGSVYAWGESYADVADQLQSEVVQVFSTAGAFAALKTDGSVVTWGEPDPDNLNLGADSSSVADDLSGGVTQIYSNYSAFAAIKDDGSVVTWGRSGGDSSDVAIDLMGDVIAISATRSAFAALKEDGSVVTWGRSGGDSSWVSSALESGVIKIFSTRDGFSALKDDGSVVYWGGWPAPFFFHSALRDDGSVEYWAFSSTYSGVSQLSQVALQLRSGVVDIAATVDGFAALKDDGSVVAWAGLTGDSAYLAVADQLASEVVEIFPGAYAFAALKTDGSLVTWGWPSDGGDSSAVADQLSSGVVEAYSGESVFAALKDDGSVVVWRGAEDGIEDDAAGVADQLTSGVVEVSNIFTNRYLVNGSEDDDTLHGYAGQNWINGHDGNDLIFGSLWDDQIQGHEGDDIIHPGLGNDVVYGGTGTDTIVLPLFANEFTYESQGPEHFDVSYRDFLIEVVGVEFVEFGSEHITRLDLQEALSSDLQTQIARLTDLYLAFFGRAPDVEGLEFWQKQLLGEGRSFQNIAKDFAWSEEAQTLFPQDASNREFVQNIYQNVFDRNPDSGGWDFWTNKLDGLGTTDLSERGAFVGELILGAYAPTSGEEDRGLLTNKHDIAMYYVNELALDPAEGFDASINDLLELVTGEPETAENAERVIDYVFEDSITLVGVMSDQALLDELWAG